MIFEQRLQKDSDCTVINQVALETAAQIGTLSHELRTGFHLSICQDFNDNILVITIGRLGVAHDCVSVRLWLAAVRGVDDKGC
jgi:outer membrane receptor for monomeric catechols